MAADIKRLLLNLSVITIAVGAFLLYNNISYNNSLNLVEATVTREYVPDGIYRSTGNRHYSDLTTEYIYYYNGKTHYESREYTTPIGMTYDDTKSLKLGDKVNFYVDDKGKIIYQEDYHFPIILLATGVLMFVFCAKAIKGYFSDFIVRYKKTHMICIIYLAFYALFSYWCNESSGGIDFGGFLVLWFLGTGVSIILLAVVWIVSVVKYHSANK